MAAKFESYSPFQKDLQSGLGLKNYEDKGNLDNKVHRMACLDMANCSVKVSEQLDYPLRS